MPTKIFCCWSVIGLSLAQGNKGGILWKEERISWWVSVTSTGIWPFGHMWMLLLQLVVCSCVPFPRVVIEFADVHCMFFLCSSRATWTRSIRTNFAGYPWRSKNLFRTAARPSLATMVSTETLFPPPRQRSWTTKRHSRRTTWRRAHRNAYTTHRFRDVTWAGFASHWDTDWWMCLWPQIYDETAPNFGPNFNQWED